MPSWKKVIVSGSDASLNSINVATNVVAQSFTGSLFGTASFAVSASQAQNATTASYVLNAVSASFATSASFVTASNVFGPFGSNSVISASFATFAETASYATNGGVTQILAGPNITVSPLSGKGQVTISSTGTGSGNFNTSTGSYGSFYDTTTQINPVANAANSMSFNETAITNGVSLSGSTNPFNTYIKTENAGVYDIQFSAQLDKTDAGKDEIVIWLRKNGTDLTDTATSVSLTNNNDKVVAAWNWFVQSAANDYYQIIWKSADADMRLLAEVSSSQHPGIPSVILTANRVDQFLSNTGSFNGTFTGEFTGSLFGTSSFATSASQAQTANTASYALNAVTASFITASNVFGPFGSNSVISSSYALTASYALNGGSGGGGGITVTHTQLTASTTWSFNHNLNTQTPLLQVYDLNYEQIIPNEIVSISAFTSEIRFDYTQAGYAVASTGGGLIITGSTSRLTQTVAATTWSFAHNLGTKYPGFEIFNSNDDVIIPAGIHAVDINNAEIYFAIPTTGIAIANFSGLSGSFENTISASFAATSSYSNQFHIGGTQTQYAAVTSSINGSNIVFNVATGSYSSAFFKYTVASASNARSGEIMSVWNGSTVTFTDNSTTDIGTTTAVTSSVAISASNAQLTMQTNTTGWRIKSIATFM